ncbi:MAG: SgcJ/EcaC family oxidoreductase [Verrucomicrobia bacterium]|nr:SgcJ/EcaC family oxidoreductase [Verrucomicrobiota bacterium]
MKTETTQIHRIIQELQAGWLAGSGAQFAAAFAPQARFVAFDGATLTGPSEIANRHQRAFDSHLQGTALDLHIEEIRLVATGVWLAWTKGGITKANGSVVERTNESVQLFVFREQGGLVVIEAFQNTRLRPVTDSQSAEVWRQFDQLWRNRGR